MSINGPVLDLVEGFDFAFALDNQAQCDGLHPACGQTTSYLVPEQRRNLISHQTIEHAACLLRVYQVAVNIAWMLEGLAHCPLSNFVKRDTTDAAVFFSLLFFLFAAGAIAP